MSSVTFSPAVGGDGSTVSDDSSPATGLASGGHRTRFVPALAQVVAVATNVVAKAAEAATSAANALAAENAAETAQAAAEAAAATATSSAAFIDTNPIVKGSVDATKRLRLEVDGFTTGVTRVLTPPNYDGTIATQAGTETLSNKTLATPSITGAANEAKGANIASASTLNLDTATGNFVHVTGTTSISSITLSAGRERTVEFDGVLTLVHNSTNLPLPGNANIVTSVGDRMIVRGESGTKTVVVSYQHADGRPVTEAVQLIATTNVTAVANIDFLTLFTPEFNKYIIEFEALVPATDGVVLHGKLAFGGVADTAGVGYTYWNSGTVNSIASGIPLSSVNSNVAGKGTTGFFEIRNTNGAGTKAGLAASAAYTTTGGALTQCSFLNSNVSPVSGFRLNFSSGNFTASGTVRVYGVRNI
ncbi:MAG: hypothetical protein ACXW1D_00730 [Halobacteriota archaeon]